MRHQRVCRRVVAGLLSALACLALVRGWRPTIINSAPIRSVTKACPREP